jgi:arylsulfatase A-like enzyme
MKIIKVVFALVLINMLVYQYGYSQNKKPNIILIVVDDMGYSDLGSYGSEIRTPNIDKLAFGGLRLKEFYNNSICAPTRASLLTGQYPHNAGIGFFDVNLGLPAYQGYLNKESLTLGEVLKTSGYTTLISGKWHVGNDSASWPLQRGFDRFYGIVGGGANYFDDGPLPLGNAPYPVKLLEDNRQVHPTAGSYYLTDEITNHAVKFIDDASASSKPFFLYLAYNAPHWPLQALPEDIAKYKGRYDIGWDSLRQERLARQATLGITDKLIPAQRDPEVPAWKSLTYDEQQLWKAKMEVYAAMLDRVDQGVGKVRQELARLKKDDNTLIIFISDNGAPAEDVAHFGSPVARNTGPVGTSGSFESQGKNWSYVSNTPLRSFKSFFYEGGFSSPFIAYYPSKIKAGTLDRGTAHIIDIAPTLYELGGAKYPLNIKGTAVHPLPGKSLTSVLFENKSLNREQPLFWEWSGNRAVRKGKWKIISIYPSYTWELYDIDNDRGETKNVAAANAAVVNELSAAYDEWAKNNNVVNFDRIKPKQPLLPPKNPQGLSN